MQNCKITDKNELSPGIFRMKIESPVIAKKRKAGQFIILKINEEGERIPLTIVDSDPARGTVTIIFQVVGKTTTLLSRLNPGDTIMDFVGPLGLPTHIEKFGAAVCIGGGIGTAPVLPIARALRDAGNRVIGILGSRSKNLLILEEQMKEVCHEVLITTDDGTYGIKGFVTTALQQLHDQGVKMDVVYAIGPVPMMKAASGLTKKLGIKTYVSLNAMMVDGTGMCGGCRVSVDGKTKFVCVDGPEFDGHLVDFDELANRLTFYREKEATSKHKFAEPGCNLGGAR
jgi:ferredoxin--NADP+ reductase